MKHFQKICDGIDVGPLREQLAAHPELWNERRNRTGKDTPFSGTSDLWLRYRDFSELLESDDYRAPHWATNYPAWDLLPAAADIVFDLAFRVRAVYIGGVMLTKIPVGGKILPHHDRGSWHASEMNCKVYVPVEANDQCVNYCGDESLVIRVGEAVSFDNQIEHSVENNGKTDRTTLICCFRVDR